MPKDVEVKTAAIVAVASNGVIGLNNQLPWYLPNDLKYFKATTMGKPLVMGRKTFESIGRPLPNRRNVILTRNPLFTATGCEIIHDVATALMFDNLFIIGGANIYTLCWPHINKLHLTLIHETIEGDAYFPELDLKAWRLVSRENHLADEKNPHDYSFLLYEIIFSK